MSLTSCVSYRAVSYRIGQLFLEGVIPFGEEVIMCVICVPCTISCAIHAVQIRYFLMS